MNDINPLHEWHCVLVLCDDVLNSVRQHDGRVRVVPIAIHHQLIEPARQRTSNYIVKRPHCTDDTLEAGEQHSCGRMQRFVRKGHCEPQTGGIPTGYVGFRSDPLAT